MIADSRAAGSGVNDPVKAAAFQPVPANWTTAVVADILVTSRLTTLLERWNGRHGGMVLAFHEIAAPQMEEQLEIVAATYSFVSLTEMIDRLAAGKSTRHLAAITLDDGVGSVTEDASGIALRRGWPMTFYLPTGVLDIGRAAWYHELPTRLHAARGTTVTVADSTFVLDSEAAIHKAIAALTARFWACRQAQAVDQLLSGLRASVRTTPDVDEKLALFAPLSWSRVRELARHDELSFEAHSVTHLAMSQLNPAQIQSEMTNSQQRIEEATGRSVRHFCYPYGGVQHIGAIAASIARKIFRSATTMARGRCTAGADLALLPRIPLYQSDTARTVTAKLALTR